MKPVWILARLTLKEAFRRRTFLAALVITALFLLVWVLTRQTEPQSPSSAEIRQLLAMQAGLGMMRFFTALIGISMAAGAVAAELERGTHYALLARPLTRAQLLLGKWLGIALACLCLYLFWGALAAGTARIAGQPELARFAHAAAIGFLYPLVFLTLTLCYSIFAAPLLSSALGMTALVIGWAEHALRNAAELFAGPHGPARGWELAAEVAGHYSPIAKIARVSAEALGLNRLEQNLPTMFTGAFGDRLEAAPWDLRWPLLHLVLVLALALFLFHRRDV